MTKTTPRLATDERLQQGASISLQEGQAHYLRNVLRKQAGDPLRLFNSRDGEWLCHLTTLSKKMAQAYCASLLAAAKPPPDIDYVFAPLKQMRLDYMVQKAVELGARRLIPVITRRTIAGRVNLERMRANVVEAAEQCNLIHVPEVVSPLPLTELLSAWSPNRVLIFCDERGGKAPVEMLAGLSPPAAVLVGPEGGFAAEEKSLLDRLPFVRGLSLGPRIMRADTAAIAALTLVQAMAGDMRPDITRPAADDK